VFHRGRGNPRCRYDGRGDAFGGTFIARRLKGDDYETAARIASRVAAKTCEAWGSWAGISELPSHDGTVAQEYRVRGALAVPPAATPSACLTRSSPIPLAHGNDVGPP